VVRAGHLNQSQDVVEGGESACKPGSAPWRRCRGRGGSLNEDGENRVVMGEMSICADKRDNTEEYRL
jgi:hypothetical protein